MQIKVITTVRENWTASIHIFFRFSYSWICLVDSTHNFKSQNRNRIHLTTLMCTLPGFVFQRDFVSIIWHGLTQRHLRVLYDSTRLGGDVLWDLLGQEKSRTWLFRRIPEGVTIPLPNGRFRELAKEVQTVRHGLVMMERRDNRHKRNFPNEKTQFEISNCKSRSP